jgi:prophage regulatory protein
MPKKLVIPDRLPEYGVLLGPDQRSLLEKAGQFPRRVQVTERRYAYVEDEILAWLASKIAARDRQREVA